MKVSVRFISDFEASEFHITPVLTFAWDKTKDWIGKAIALEWGIWSLYFGMCWRTK